MLLWLLFILEKKGSSKLLLSCRSTYIFNSGMNLDEMLKNLYVERKFEFVHTLYCTKQLSIEKRALI